MCGQVTLCFGPPRNGVCANCTDALAFAHGLLDAQVEMLGDALDRLVKALPWCDVCDKPAHFSNLYGYACADCDEHHEGASDFAGEQLKYADALRHAQTTLRHVGRGS